MEKDCRELTVHAMNFLHGRGPVFYASLPCKPYAGETLKHRLVSILWDHLVTMQSPLWKRCQSSNRAAFPVQVVRGLLGRPQLLLGECRGPAITFSQGGGQVWAALCGDESDIGIDVAGTDEFQREYPFQRVFHPQELQHALSLAGGNMERLQPCSGLSRKPLSRLWDLDSIWWTPGKSASSQQRKMRADVPFQWACRGKFRRGFPWMPAGLYGYVRFPGSRCGFPSRF